MQRTARSFPGLSRNELAHTVCEHLNLHAPSGGNRVHTARRLLEQLEELGILVLPDKDESKRRGAQKAPAWTARSEPGAEIGGGLEGLEPLELRVVTEPHEVARWNELIDRHHYLGYRRPVGPHLRYAIVDRRGRWLGCLLFSYAARSLPCRDDFIGWDEAAPAQAPGPGARQPPLPDPAVGARRQLGVQGPVAGDAPAGRRLEGRATATARCW